MLKLSIYLKVNDEVAKYVMEDSKGEVRLILSEMEYNLLCKFNGGAFPPSFVNQRTGTEYEFYDCNEVDGVGIVATYREIPSTNEV